MSKHAPAALTFALSLAAATTLLAQAPSTDVDAVTSTPAAPVVQEGAAGVQYLNGGAGEGERGAMRSQHAAFPLQIAFSGKGGEYGVADQVRVLQGAQPVLAVDSAGPLLMVKLPPGRYTVEADIAGTTQRRSVELGAAPRTVNWSSALLSQ